MLDYSCKFTGYYRQHATSVPYHARQRYLLGDFILVANPVKRIHWCSVLPGMLLSSSRTAIFFAIWASPGTPDSFLYSSQVDAD